MTYWLARPDCERWSGNDNIAFSRLLRTFSTLFLAMTFFKVVVFFINEKHYYLSQLYWVFRICVALALRQRLNEAQRNLWVKIFF